MLRNLNSLLFIALLLQSYSIFAQDDQQYSVPTEFIFLDELKDNPDSLSQYISIKTKELEKSSNDEFIKFYTNLGKYFLSKGSYNESLDFFQISKSKLEKEDYLHLAEIENKIGDVSKYLKKNDEAFESYFASLNISKKHILNYWAAESYNNIGDIYRSLKDFKMARMYYDSCFSISNKMEYENLIANTYNNYADLLNSENNLDSAKELYKKSLEIYKKNNNLEFAAENYNSLAEISIKESKINEAKWLLNQGFEILKNGNYYSELVKNIKLLKKLSKSTSDTLTYLNTLEFENILIKNQLKKRLTSQKSALKIKSEFDKIQNQNLILKKEKENDTILKSGLIIALVIIVLILILLYSKYSQKKKFNEIKDENNRQIISQKQKIESAFSNIEKLNLDLNKANQTKDKFFSILAHDLKGPIGNLNQISKIIVEEFNTMDKEEMLDFIESMEQSSEAIQTLLENLLQWSRVQMGRIDFRPEVFELKRVLKHVLALLITSANNKNIKLVDNIPADIHLMMDSNMINTALRNLISNSIKFTPEGGEIQINFTKKDKFVEVSVKDNGVGISQDNIDKLFKIGENHSTLGTSQEKGTGLGLILCMEFVEMHGGKIWAQSEVGVGTEFIFTLPKKTN
jgi:signal transduction histidine kinase